MRKHKFGLTIGILTVTGLTAGAYYSRRPEPAADIVTAAVTRGDIVSQIASTGTLEAVTTVEVGTQVSGSIQELNADFNSIVKKGQIIARLDPSQFQTQVDSAKANLNASIAAEQGAQVNLDDATVKAVRARDLAGKQLIAPTDLDTAEVAVKSAAAQVASARAQVSQAKAALTQAQVNLEKTVIAAPIDGIVIDRSVDVGQTVAASLQAPTLFTLAADLTEMQVHANIDESDLGDVHQGQDVSFRVDAYPTKAFKGTVTQVRLNPVVSSNVVTYSAIIAAPNLNLELKPGMTANITINVGRRDDVLRVPTAALKFRPTEAVLASLGQDPAVLAKTRSLLPASESEKAAAGTVWRFDGGLHPEAVQTGMSDATYTEVTGGLSEGATVATRVNADAAKPAAAASSPLLQQQGPPRRF